MDSGADDACAGGKKILQRVAGKDASKQFWKYHNEGILKKYKAKLQVGSLDSKPKAAEPAPAPKKAAAPKKPATATSTEAAKTDASEPLEAFGEQIPFADPSWYQNVSFPLHLARFLSLRNEGARPWNN